MVEHGVVPRRASSAPSPHRCRRRPLPPAQCCGASSTSLMAPSCGLASSTTTSQPSSASRSASSVSKPTTSPRPGTASTVPTRRSAGARRGAAVKSWAMFTVGDFARQERRGQRRTTDCGTGPKQIDVNTSHEHDASLHEKRTYGAGKWTVKAVYSTSAGTMPLVEHDRRGAGGSPSRTGAIGVPFAPSTSLRLRGHHPVCPRGLPRCGATLTVPSLADLRAGSSGSQFTPVRSALLARWSFRHAIDKLRV